MIRFWKSFQEFREANYQSRAQGSPPFDIVQAAFDEGFRQGTMAGKEAALPEQEVLERSYSDGFQMGYLNAINDGGQYNCRVSRVEYAEAAASPTTDYGFGVEVIDKARND